VDEEQLMEVALDAGADDIQEDEKEFEVVTDPGAFDAVKEALDKTGITYLLAEVTMHPQSVVQLEGKNAEQMLRLMEQLEDHEDIQKVYANFDIPEGVMEQLSA
jgi:transcriptional/translational regulatory protein YebC/TACO1